jgi:hypothetical protein
VTWHNGEGTHTADTHPEVQPGQRVRHALFGDGVVTSRHQSGGRDVVAVSFPDPFGSKVLRLAHTQLTVLSDRSDTPGENAP